MKALKLISVLALVAVLSGLAVNQWLLHRQWLAMSQAAAAHGVTQTENADAAAERLRRAEEQLIEARTQLQIAAQRLASAQAQASQISQHVQLSEGGGRRPRLTTGLVPHEAIEIEGDVEVMTRKPKRSWGPEQAAGAPDTQLAGDISTAWAAREQDAGEEWLKLDYESSVDIAEVRVRETYNPGAVSKITAFTADGKSEITLWEGIEPPSEAPVEMSFPVPMNVNAKSIKVYLDTARVPGWNEIDAVELIGRDGSRQWARQVSASSTFAEPRVLNERREVLRLGFGE